MYTIKRAAELTGVPVATLRAWERRYGIGSPERTDSGYRLYDEQSIADINAMQHLISQGWAPRQAAEAAVKERAAIAVPSAAPEALEQQLAEIRARVLGAARAMDERELGKVLDQMFANASYEFVVDHWLMPVMHDLGEQWIEGNLDISAEHLVSNAVMRRLGAAFEAAPLPAHGPLVLVGLPSESYHEIGALAFATAARRIGLAALYLGANVPQEAWITAVDAHRAAAIVLSVVRSEDVPLTNNLVKAIRDRHKELVFAVGGPRQAEVAGPVLHLPEGFAASAAAVAQRLRENA